MNRHHLLIFLLLSVASLSWAQESFQVQSPSGEFAVSVKVADSIYYSVTANRRPVINPSAIALITADVSFGVGSTVQRNVSRSVNEAILNPVPFKRKKITDRYNELTLEFRENFSLVFRAYNDGVAYRFATTIKDSIQINKEIASFRFNESDSVYFPQVQKRDNLDIYHTSFEEPYRKEKLSTLRSTDLGFSPVLIRGGINIVITESDLWDYPGMFLRGTGKSELRGDFAAYPDKEEIQGGEFRQPVVVGRRNFIARSSGRRTFPWRVIVLAKEDKDLLSNDLVYRLGKPPSKLDWSWVQPGISTEEWISGSNIYGVNFESGINTATYKYYIDFASRFGMQYVMLDAGWSDYNDLFRITPGLDLEELSAYAKTKNIGLILWTLSMTLDRQLEQALTMFNKLGVKAIMTDFMDRDDQKMMTFYQRIGEATARHKIMVMFHGAFKNAGFERTFPNAITREAVLGSEYNIWSEKASPEHDLLIPFIRMVSGPMDYEPGSMINANKRTFRALPDKVMSQGTRCHQLAMFVAYDSPLQMFSGNPSDAWKEIDFTTFLASLPTVWDETVVLEGKLGDYLILARRKDRDWYVTAMTDWTPREFEVDLSFLEKGQFRAFTMADGVNASQDASDYQMGYELVSPDTKLKIKMAPGGGYVAKLIRLNDARP
jgi:alpha-glucosidase